MNDQWSGLPDEATFRRVVLPLYTPCRVLRQGGRTRTYELHTPLVPTRATFGNIYTRIRSTGCSSPWSAYAADHFNEPEDEWYPDTTNIVRQLRSLAADDGLTKDELEYMLRKIG